MGLLEETLIKAKSAANAIGEKAGKIVDVSKLNFELVDLKSSLKSKFENIGKIVYGEIKNDCFSEVSIEKEIKQIDDVFYKIEKLKKEIALIKNKIVCKACGSENSSNALYCNNCGHTLEIKCTCNEECNKSKVESCENPGCECGDDCHDNCTCDKESFSSETDE